MMVARALMSVLNGKSVIGLRVAIAAALTASCGVVSGQTVVVPDVTTGPATIGKNPSPKALEIEAERQWNKRRYDAEQQLRRIRAAHFKGIKDDAKRNEGLAKLRTFTDPAAFGPMLDVMGDQSDDVLLAMVEVFDQDKANAGESALTAAMLDLASPVGRQAAQRRVSARLATTGTLGPGARQLIDAAIRGSNDQRRSRALDYVSSAGLVEFIPSMIGGQTLTKNDDSPGGDNANITIGNQISYVQRLRAVVSENAAAFDPEVGVLNTGAQLQVRNAFVTINRVEVNAVLVKMSDELTGTSTAVMGYETPKWAAWYEKFGKDRIGTAVAGRIASAKEAVAKAAVEKKSVPIATPDMSK